MAENKELVYTVKIKTEGGDLVEKQVNSLNELEQSARDVEEALKKAPLGSAEWKQLNNDLKNSTKSLDDAKQASMSFGDKLSAIPGPIGGVVQGVKGLNTAFKALIANPIGLVIAAIALALTTLYKAFTSTKAGAEKMERVMAALGAAMDVLRDRVLKVGGAIVKFFSGDFSGAFEDAKDAVSGIGSEIANEMNAAAKATKTLQQVTDKTRELNTERAKLNLTIADAKLKINDENLSLADRLKALEEVRAEEIKLAKQEEELAKQRYLALKALADLSDSSKETLDELAAAEQEMYRKQLESKQKQKELFDQEKALRDRQRAEAKAAADERKRQLEEVNKLTQTLTLSAIKDEDFKASETLRIQYEETLKSIDNLKTTEAKKGELRLLAQQTYNNELEKREQERAQKEKDAAIQTAKELYDIKVRSLNADIELEQMKLEKKTELDQQDIQRLKDLLTKQMELQLEAEGLTSEEILLIRAKTAQAIEALDNQVTENKKKNAAEQEAVEMAQLQGISDLFGALAGAATEGSAFQKAAAIAQAQINTIISASNAYKSMSEVPVIGPALAPIAAAAAVVAGMKSIQQIMAIPEPTPPKNPIKAATGIVGVGTPTGDNIPAMLSPGESVINSAATGRYANILDEINNIGNNSPYNASIINKLDNLEGSMNMSNQPIKTYVVSSDMTNQQQMDMVVKSRSVF